MSRYLRQHEECQEGRPINVHGTTNLLGQDKKEYAKLNKIMQQGFSDAANREHEPKVNREIDTFIKMISEDKNPGNSADGWCNPKNMTLWCRFSTHSARYLHR
jgi:cytochrome P450